MSSHGTSDLDGMLRTMITEGRVKVPPYPAVAMRLQRLISGDDYTVASVAQLVSLDQTLAAAILRYANSAAMRGGVPAKTVQDACARIGAKNVSALVTALGLGEASGRPGPLAQVRHTIWRRATTRAEVARRMAGGRGVPPDVAFTAALLYDFGSTVAVACIEELILNRKEGPRPAEVWLQTAESYRFLLGALVVRHWKLPKVIECVMTGAEADEPMLGAVRSLVETAHAVAKQLEESPVLDREDLGHIPGLRLAEMASIVDEIHRIPAATYALVPDTDTKEEVPTAVEPPKTTLRTTVFPTSFAITAVRRSGDLEFWAQGVSADGLVMTGPNKHPENQCAKLVLALGEGDPLEVFGSVTLCTGLPSGGFRLEFRPMALRGPVQREWMALYQRAKSAAEAAA